MHEDAPPPPPLLLARPPAARPHTARPHTALPPAARSLPSCRRFPPAHNESPLSPAHHGACTHTSPPHQQVTQRQRAIASGRPCGVGKVGWGWGGWVEVGARGGGALVEVVVAPHPAAPPKKPATRRCGTCGVREHWEARWGRRSVGGRGEGGGGARPIVRGLGGVLCATPARPSEAVRGPRVERGWCEEEMGGRRSPAQRVGARGGVGVGGRAHCRVRGLGGGRRTTPARPSEASRGPRVGRVWCGEGIGGELCPAQRRGALGRGR